MNWRNWCRLCGSFESLSKVDEIVMEITKKLEVNKLLNKLIKLNYFNPFLDWK